MEQKALDQKTAAQKTAEQKTHEQKPVNLADVQLAHHWIQDIFRVLGAVNYRPYPASSGMPIFYGMPAEWRQPSYNPYIQTQSAIPGWAAPQWVMRFSPGFVA